MMLSRVADQLYWINRFLERAEHTSRLLGVILDDMHDQNPYETERRWRILCHGLSLDGGELPPGFREIGPNFLLEQFVLDANEPASVFAQISKARENARQVREQLSSEMWFHLNKLYQDIRLTSVDDIWQDSPHGYLQYRLKDGIQTFQGITDSTMSHGEGWHFLQVGRYIERAFNTARLVETYFSVVEPVKDKLPAYVYDLEWVSLLKSCTAFEAYSKEYTAAIDRNRVAEYLLLNQEFPRSVRFCADRLQESVKEIAVQTESLRRNAVSRFSGRLSALLDFRSIDEILEEGLTDYCADVVRLCTKVHDELYNLYINPHDVIVG